MDRRWLATVDRRKVFAVLFGLLAIVGWSYAAISSIVQKTNADSRISDAFDISAVQIQQLNGSVTSHILMAVAVAGACTNSVVGIRRHRCRERDR
jgi:hypothetical protein